MTKARISWLGFLLPPAATVRARVSWLGVSLPPPAPAGPAPSFAISPSPIQATGQPQIVTLTGTNTTWTSSSLFELVPTSGVLLEQVTATVNGPAYTQLQVQMAIGSTGTLTIIADGVSASVPVTLTLAPPPPPPPAPPPVPLLVALSCQVSFASPSAPPVWVDVTPYLQAFKSHRGRSFELDRQEAGTATVTLDNRNHYFDPVNTASPYYPNVASMNRIRVSATFQGTSYPVFTGFVEKWPQQWATYDDAWSPAECIDGFKVFALFKMYNVARPQELSGARIGALLDYLGWPATDRRLDNGQSLIQASTISDYALSHLQQVATDSELGRLFIDASGSVVFLDRSRPSFPPYNTSQASFGEDAGMLMYADIMPSFADDSLWNEVRVTTNGGTTQVATDAASVTQFYKRTLEKNVIVASDGTALDIASGLLLRYKRQAYRFESVVIDPTLSAAHWVQVLTRELGDRIAVQHRWPTGGRIQQQCYIEMIDHDWSAVAPHDWKTTWALSPATGAMWVLGVAGSSELGTTTIAGW